MLKHSLALALAMGMASSASALVISDINNPYTFMEQGESMTIVHDLTDDNVPTDFSVVSATLTLGFSDGILFQDLALDIADIYGDGISGSFEVDGTHTFGFDIRALNVGNAGISTLNSSGQLEVTLTAANTPRRDGFNDFWWKTSRLDATVLPREVPEPGTLALMGLALVGLGLRRKYAA